MPRHALETPARYGGFLHLNRRSLAITAALFVAGLATIDTVPADAAEPLSKPEYAASLQSLAIPADAIQPLVVHDAFSISHFTVVGPPLAGNVTMTAGFGHRHAPCAACSSEHQGVDWTPGAGTPIQSVTDGVVVEASSGGGFGVHAKIEHNVDGVKYYSLYAHMQSGSLAVGVGDTVSTGQHIGNVGNTGTSTGAHLHFEIHDATDTPIDPAPWLAAHVNS